MRGNPTCRELFFLCTAASKSWNPHGKFPFKVAESAAHRRPLRAPPSLLRRKCQRGEIDKKKKRRRFCARASCVSMVDCTKLNMRGDGWTHADRLQRAGPQFPSSLKCKRFGVSCGVQLGLVLPSRVGSSAEPHVSLIHPSFTGGGRRALITSTFHPVSMDILKTSELGQ